MSKKIKNMTKQIVTIKKKLPHGYLVQNKNKRLGLLRAREVTWDENELWETKFKLDESIEVIQTVLWDGNREYSYRLAERDPWHKLYEKYDINQIVTGIVEHVSRGTVWMELEPGVTGVLHRKDLPNWLDDRYDMHSCFWPGDQLKASITYLDYQDRLVRLSLANARQRYDADRTLAYSEENRSALRKKKREKTYESLAQITTKKVWIVEDDKAQRESLGRWLERQGHQVTIFESAEECLEQLPTGRCDVVLTDIGLPNMDGVAFVQQLARQYPELCCAMMTDLLRINQDPDMQICIDQGYLVLCKPVLPEDIAKLLLRIENGRPKKRERRNPRNAKIAQTNNQFKLHTDKQAKMHILQTLLQQTSAELAIVFSITSTTRQVEIIAKVGDLKINTTHLSRLIHSPVRDVVEDKQQIYIENAHEQSEYSRYLKSVVSFCSCIGHPIATGLNHDYGLFIFHRKPKFFLHYHLAYVDASSFRLAGVLEQEKLMTQVSGLQQLAMLGNLSRSMVHELNHKLGPIVFAIEDLQEACGEISKLGHIDAEKAQIMIVEASNYVNILAGSIDGLMHTAKLFGELTAQTPEELIKVEDTIDDVVWIVRDLAKDYKVQVNWEKPQKMHLTRANAAHLQQVLLNTMVNSLQQIDEMRHLPQSLIGLVQIDIGYVKDKEEAQRDWIEILIQDNGPGIHQAVWERIFECGYTHGRADGTGLGLFISRNLLQEMNGEMFVKDSQRLWGTTFCIQLPVTLI